MRSFVPKNIGFKISKDIWEKILEYYKNNYTGVIPKSFPIELFATQRIESAKSQLKRLKFLGIKKGFTYLDAGCGIGSLVALANKSGLNYYGYDIDKKAIEIAHEILEYNGISKTKIKYAKNNNPFPKTKFDLITSFEVAEHTKDLDLYLNKMVRMLKPRGKIFLETPNYLIPYEPHYYLFLPPLPRTLRWFVCKLRGRSNKIFFDELNFVTPKHFEEVFKKTGLKVENLGRKEWYKEIMTKHTPNRSLYFRLISSAIRTTKTGFIAKYLAQIGLYTPQIYIIRK